MSCINHVTSSKPSTLENLTASGVFYPTPYKKYIIAKKLSFICFYFKHHTTHTVSNNDTRKYFL